MAKLGTIGVRDDSCSSDEATMNALKNLRTHLTWEVNWIATDTREKP
jgi:hypothetical protein